MFYKKIKYSHSAFCILNSTLIAFLQVSFCFFLSHCAPSEKTGESESIYHSDYPLTEDIAYSLSSDLTVRIPLGWTAAEDNDCKCIDLWLIREDFSATLNLMTYEVDDVIRKSAINGNLDTLVYFSKELKRLKLQDHFKEVREDEYFQIKGKPFASYEYIGDENLPIRVVVFQYQGRIFELSAMPAQKIGHGKVDTKELFTVQQTILASIK